MGIGHGFTYVFQDKDWIKRVLIGFPLVTSVLSIPALFGYYLEVSPPSPRF